MATESKRNNKGIRRLLLIIGLIFSITGIEMCISVQNYLAREYNLDIFDIHSSYEDTVEFRHYIEKRFATLVAMGVNSDYISVYSLDSTGERTPYFQGVPEDDFASGNHRYLNDHYLNAKVYNSIIKKDRNIIYFVTKGDKVLYTNYGSDVESEVSKPEGYNYEFRYSNGRVSASKDGRNIDLYGDKYYKDENDWYIPGYRNFTASGTMKLNITIYAREYPKYYSNFYNTNKYRSVSDYYNSHFQKEELNDDEGWFMINEPYYIAKKMQTAFELRHISIWLVIIGILLLAGALLLRWSSADVSYMVLMIILIASYGECLVAVVLTSLGRWSLYRAVIICMLVAALSIIFVRKHFRHTQKVTDAAIENSIANERMKVELVTNVSHDIKTPLTSIISYIGLLKEEELPDYAMDYVNIIDEKSQRLKSIVQDVFDVSKAASGQLPVDIQVLDYGKLINQTLADMQTSIDNSRVTVVTDIPDEPLCVNADGNRMYRVIQNLVQNALQYSLADSRVHIKLNRNGHMITAYVSNVSAIPLDNNVDYSERFVRGDNSRTDGGSGLGLSIAKSFTEACGGQFDIEIYADMFTASVSLPEGDRMD